MAYRVIVTIDHECSLLHLQNQLKQHFGVYCTGHFDYFMFYKSLSGNKVQQLINTLDYSPDSLNLVSTGTNQTLCILPCKGESSDHLLHFYELIFSNLGIVFDYPRITKAGEQYMYHCLDDATHAKVLEQLETKTTFQINSIIEYPADDYYGNYLLSIPDLSNELTRNQSTILFDAYKGGYYKIPREIRTLDIGERQGKSRYNIDKLLRAAENKIMHHIYPFL